MTLYRKTYIDEGHGYGLFSESALPAGTRLFEEYPLIAMQHAANKKAGVRVCERCFRFLGPLESQMRALLSACSSSVVVPERLPCLGDEQSVETLPVPVPCPGGCDLQFCSEECASANFRQHHRLMCAPCVVVQPVPPIAAATAGDASAAAAPKRKFDAAAARIGVARIAPPLEDQLTGMQLGDAAGATAAASGASSPSGSSIADATPAGSSTLMAVDVTDATTAVSAATVAAAAGSSSAAAGAEDSGGIESLSHLEPLPRFIAHAHATNEIFLLAAKATCLVLCRVESVLCLESATAAGGGASDVDAAYAEAMAPFAGPKWWDAVATPDEVTDEAAFRRTLRALLTESWTLLAAVVGRHAPAGCALFASVDAYATIVGAFERRNCAVQVASPVEAYFLRVDALPEGAAKAAITAVTSPLLDALDAAYATPFDGTGLFPLQATLNHSCEPNVTLLKEEGPEESDGRVVARLTRDVAEGEELCNAYVDISLPLRRRRRELREYGFECMCPRCVREAAAASEKKASDKKAGKRRLK